MSEALDFTDEAGRDGEDPPAASVSTAPPPSAGDDHETERRARMALSCIADAGDPAIATALARSGAVPLLRAIIGGDHGPAMAERARRVDLTDIQAAIAAGRFRFVMPGDPEWPPGLDELSRREPIQRRGGAPYGLWLQGPGDLAALASRSVAIVGSRAASSYGIAVAEQLAQGLAAADVAVVSGGAYGIDAAAHRGALGAPGPTIAVLACGVDVRYPPTNTALLNAIADDHLLVSELPPGAYPTRVRFLARNRLIAAMTGGTIVVEAAIRSGARNTANWAALCNRQLMAVPASIFSALAVTPHLLIREGQANMITSAAEVLELLSAPGEHLLPLVQGPRRPTDGMDEVRLAVFEAVPRTRYRTAGEIALSADVSMPRCLAELSALSDAGLVRSGATGWRLA